MFTAIKYFTIGLLLSTANVTARAADSTYYIKVHFLYGSKPKREYKSSEKKWFGGKLGGHTGIEFDSNTIIDFVHQGNFHYIAHKKDCHSRFAIHNPTEFWEIFGGETDSVKKLSVTIPITAVQKRILDSLTQTYTSNTPYDYAFIGMRCGAATYDILSQLGIVKSYSHRKTYRKIFYPKKLRKRILKMAQRNHWEITRQAGTRRRKWERD